MYITAFTMFKVIREEIYKLEVQVDLYWSKKTKRMLKIEENITETRSVTDHTESDNKKMRMRDCWFRPYGFSIIIIKLCQILER